jgi:RNA polymerase sigma factor (TIGR02999 family)
MRQILIDYARHAAADKRDAGRRISLDPELLPDTDQAEELLALDKALNLLEKLDERLARTVELRFFGGLSVEETADVLSVSPRTVKRDWRKARAFLHDVVASRNTTR